MLGAIVEGQLQIPHRFGGGLLWQTMHEVNIKIVKADRFCGGNSL